MAREDLLANLLHSLISKEEPPAQDDNTLIQKMVAPNDYVQMQDNAPVLTKYTPANFKWGGLQFNSATFSRNSPAYNTDGSYAGYNPRYVSGLFNQAIYLEESTTNLFNNANIVTGGHQDWGIATTTDGLCGVQGARFSSQGVYYLPSVLGIVAGNTYTVTCWFRVSASRAAYPSSYLALTREGTGGTSYQITNITQIGVWQKASITWTEQVGQAGALCFYSIGAGSGATNQCTWDITAIQVEQKSYATSFVNGTRQSESLTMPTSGIINLNQGTMEFTINALHWVTYPYFMSCGTGGWTSPNALHFQTEPNGNMWFCYGGAVISANQSGVLTSGQSVKVAATWNNLNIALYVNGVKKSTGVATSYPALASVINLLQNQDSNGFVGNFDDVCISNIARTDASILARATSGQPLPVDQNTTCKLNFDGNLLNTAYYSPGWIWGAGQYK